MYCMFVRSSEEMNEGGLEHQIKVSLFKLLPLMFLDAYRQLFLLGLHPLSITAYCMYLSYTTCNLNTRGRPSFSIPSSLIFSSRHFIRYDKRKNRELNLAKGTYAHTLMHRHALFFSLHLRATFYYFYILNSHPSLFLSLFPPFFFFFKLSTYSSTLSSLLIPAIFSLLHLLPSTAFQPPSASAPFFFVILCVSFPPAHINLPPSD